MLVRDPLLKARVETYHCGHCHWHTVMGCAWTEAAARYAWTEAAARHAGTGTTRSGMVWIGTLAARLGTVGSTRYGLPDKFGPARSFWHVGLTKLGTGSTQVNRLNGLCLLYLTR